MVNVVKVSLRKLLIVPLSFIASHFFPRLYKRYPLGAAVPAVGRGATALPDDLFEVMKPVLRA